MARVIKWVLGLAVVAGLVYIGLVAVTGSQIRSIAEDQLQAYSAQSPESETEIIWHETGFWRSTGEVRVTMQLDEDLLEVVHAFRLRHGALRASVEGDVRGSFDDMQLNDMLFAGQAINLEGRIGLGGVRLTYAVPEIHYVDEALEMRSTAAPFTLDLVLREDEQHSQLHVEWVEIMSTSIGASDGLRWEDIEVTSQARLNPNDGLFDHGHSVFRVGQMVFGDGEDSIARIDGLLNETDMAREAGMVDVDNRLTVEAYDIYGVAGDLTLNIQLGPIPFESFQNLQRHGDDAAAMSAFLHDMQQANSRLIIDTMELTMGQMGDLVAAGEFQLRQDINLQQDFSVESAGDLLEGRLEVSDLPLLLLMPLSGLVSGELPWTLELRQGDLLINGETLELPAM